MGTDPHPHDFTPDGGHRSSVTTSNLWRVELHVRGDCRETAVFYWPAEIGSGLDYGLR